KKESAVNGFTIERGSFYFFTDTAGYSNTYLFKPKEYADVKDSTQPKKTELEKITLTDVRITIDEQKKRKFHDLAVNNLKIDIDDRNAVNLLLSVKSDILVHSLAFNVM